MTHTESILQSTMAASLIVQDPTISVDSRVSSITIDGSERKPEQVPDLGWKLDLGKLDLATIEWHPRVLATSSLTVLYLNDGGLDFLPEEIIFLSQLKRLYLDNNNLQTLPANVSQMGSLEILSAYGNELTSLPPNMSSLIHLYLLRLGGNDLDANALIQARVWRIAMLRELYLRDNKRLKRISSEILQLMYLEVIDIVGCPIEYPPKGIAENGVHAIKEYVS